MKRNLALILVMAFAIMPAIAQSNAQRYEIKLHDFTHLEIDNNISVDYIANQDSAGIAVFYATPELASRLYFTDKGKGKVDIQCCADCSNSMEYPHVTIYSTELHKVVNSGDSLVTVSSNPAVERFDASLFGNGRLSIRNIEAKRVDAKIATGNGQLVISGRCTEATLNVVGTGTIQADELKAVKGKASIIGTGTIGCDFSESLSINGMGTGRVLYRNAPKTVKSRSIGIKSELLNPTAD